MDVDRRTFLISTALSGAVFISDPLIDIISSFERVNDLVPLIDLTGVNNYNEAISRLKAIPCKKATQGFQNVINGNLEWVYTTSAFRSINSTLMNPVEYAQHNVDAINQILFNSKALQRTSLGRVVILNDNVGKQYSGDDQSNHLAQGISARWFQTGDPRDKNFDVYYDPKYKVSWGAVHENMHYAVGIYDDYFSEMPNDGTHKLGATYSDGTVIPSERQQLLLPRNWISILPDRISDLSGKAPILDRCSVANLNYQNGIGINSWPGSYNWEFADRFNLMPNSATLNIINPNGSKFSGRVRVFVANAFGYGFNYKPEQSGAPQITDFNPKKEFRSNPDYETITNNGHVNLPPNIINGYLMGDGKPVCGFGKNILVVAENINSSRNVYPMISQDFELPYRQGIKVPTINLNGPIERM